MLTHIHAVVDTAYQLIEDATGHRLGQNSLLHAPNMGQLDS